jgi:hypothetical protein
MICAMNLAYKLGEEKSLPNLIRLEKWGQAGEMI